MGKPFLLLIIYCFLGRKNKEGNSLLYSLHSLYSSNKIKLCLNLFVLKKRKSSPIFGNKFKKFNLQLQFNKEKNITVEGGSVSLEVFKMSFVKQLTKYSTIEGIVFWEKFCFLCSAKSSVSWVVILKAWFRELEHIDHTATHQGDVSVLPLVGFEPLTRSSR